MSYMEAKAKYAALGVDTDAAIAKLKNVPVALHCWQGDDVGGTEIKEDKDVSNKEIIKKIFNYVCSFIIFLLFKYLTATHRCFQYGVLALRYTKQILRKTRICTNGD